MNTFRNKNISLIVVCWLGIIISFLQVSCRKTTEPNKHILSVDMSKEHDAGKFKPEQGDKVFVAGNFNGWKKNEILLSDPKGNWIYSAGIDEYLKGRDENTPDTLEFNFIVLAGDNRQLLNQGWEMTDRRKIARTALENKLPVFIYNEKFNETESFDVTFRVGMNNQKTLGFFQPDKGDEIIVSGSFCAWSPEGIALSDEGAGIYSKKITITQNPKEPLEYRFRIALKRKAILPNQGWETQMSRQWNLSASITELPYVEFNDIRRVARFIIKTTQWEKEGKFKPFKGDILQIKLLFDGKETLSDALFQVKDQEYETALIVPLTVKDVQWQVVRNMKEELTQSRGVDVDLNGKIINN